MKKIGVIVSWLPELRLQNVDLFLDIGIALTKRILPLLTKAVPDPCIAAGGPSTFTDSMLH